MKNEGCVRQKLLLLKKEEKKGYDDSLKNLRQ